MHPRGRQYDRLRRSILARDGWRCSYCGGPATVVDHVTPVSRGGSPTDPANLTAACATCNRLKSDN